MKGGENEFVDGFQLAQIVKENHPEEWKTLTQVPINFWDIGESDVSDFTGEFHKITARPTFE